MPRYDQVRVVDPVLTTVAQGFKPPEYVGDKLLPVIQTEKMGGIIRRFGPDDFKLYDTRRARAAKSKRIEAREGDTVKLALHEESLEIAIDINERSEAPNQAQLEARRVRVVTNNIYTRKEKDQADVVLDPTNYANGHVEDLSSGDVWDQYETSDPVTVIEDGKSTVRTKTGHRANTLLLGATTFDTLKQHPKLLERIKYSMKGILTIELMKEIFGIDEIIVGESLYADSKDALHDIWPNIAVLAYTPPANERGEEVPSFGYTFRKKGHPQSGMYKEGNKLDIIEVWDVYDPMILGPSAGFLIRNTKTI